MYGRDRLQESKGSKAAGDGQHRLAVVVRRVKVIGGGEIEGGGQIRRYRTDAEVELRAVEVTGFRSTY